jgi:HD-GYP domain-containing protein (c-di-GMP phosphodiesterase class II)
MKVKPNQLQVGCILSTDVSSFSKQVLMRKKTVLNEGYIAVLKAFLVEVVTVEATLVNGNPFIPKDVSESKDEKQIKDKNQIHSFMDLYLQAVKRYKRLFQSWQAGAKVELIIIRKILVSLLEKLNEEPNELMSIHHYASKEDYIYHHAVSVGVLSAYLGRKLNFSKAEEIQLGIAGMMADSGMSQIPNTILDKRVSLTSSEYEEINNHPMYSYQMIKDIPGVTDALMLGVLQHHEREDGSGYPMAVSSTKLHKFSKVIAVIDVYHAMASERFYKQKQSPFKVIEIIVKDNFGKFDIRVVQTLANLISNFSVGTRIRLNNNDKGEVVFLEPHAPIRPMIRIETTGEYIKLAERNDLYIEEIIYS